MFYTEHRSLCEHGAFADDKNECGLNRTTAAEETVLKEVVEQNPLTCIRIVSRKTHSKKSIVGHIAHNEQLYPYYTTYRNNALEPGDYDK